MDKNNLFTHFATQSTDQVFKKLIVTEQGLSSHEVTNAKKNLALTKLKKKKLPG